jgi:hypothetical protein
MFRSVSLALIVVGAMALTYVAFRPVQAADTTGSAKMLVHNVYFQLNDPTPANIQKLVEACHKYLSKHPGTVFYAAGTLSNLDRPVNDRDWDVGLHVIFADRAAHDAYQVHPEHLKFIEENKPSWKKVRVFDTDGSKG